MSAVPPIAFSADLVHVDNSVVVVVQGEIDVDTAPRVQALVEQALRHSPFLVLDVNKVTFMDSSGLSVIAWAAGHYERVTLRWTPPQIRRLLAISGLSASVQIDGQPT